MSDSPEKAPEEIPELPRDVADDIAAPGRAAANWRASKMTWCWRSSGLTPDRAPSSKKRNSAWSNPC
ncbi:hypothetical protein BH11PSE10_BH11PSE10_15630 [soil metagenome]